MGAYLYLKALHIISVVSWFAGLLYIVRLYIYHVEAESKPAAERDVLKAQFIIMERMLWYAITWPAMIATVGFGTALLVLTQAYLQPWFMFKAVFLCLLLGYHLACGGIRRDLAADQCRLTSVQLRIWNEVATLLMFIIIFTAVLKSPLAAGKAMIGVAAFAAALVIGLTIARKRRVRK